MKTISLFIASILLGGLLLVVAPQKTFAACPEGQVETSFSWGGKTCFDKDNKSASSSNPIYATLLAIFNFMAIGVGIVVTGGIVYGAILYAASNGNAQHSQQGITIIVNSVIGLLLFIFMYAILNFIVPGGLFK